MAQSTLANRTVIEGFAARAIVAWTPRAFAAWAGKAPKACSLPLRYTLTRFRAWIGYTADA